MSTYSRQISAFGVTAIGALVISFSAMAGPKFKADVPSSLITPDKVETKYLGELKFHDGFPDKATVEKTYDFLDTSRASQVFLNAMSIASTYAMLEGQKKAGLKLNEVAIFEERMDARTLFLTPQTTTPYATAEVDVKNGPVVIDNPGPILGILDDAFFLYVTDIGFAGPDKGKGGKYLIVGPDYKDPIPEGYHVFKTKTYRHWLIMRLFVQDGKVAESVAAFKAGFKMYPLSQAENPPKQVFHNWSGKKYNTIHASDETFYEELNEAVQYEPADAFRPEITGQMTSIGIKKGQPFAPDARMKKILKEAAAIGNASARALVFRPRDKKAYFYPDRQWYTSLNNGYDFMNQGALGQDDRPMFHYYATGITPAMVTPKVGTGSVYEIAAHDAQGEYLDGGKNYTVTLPAPIPVKNFWSFMVYDVQTRSILETDQKSGGVDSNAPGLKTEKDGSAVVHFGPKPPKDKEGNWVQTMPGKGFNVLLRLYGPLEPWFDRSWKPGDFELVK